MLLFDLTEPDLRLRVQFTASGLQILADAAPAGLRPHTVVHGRVRDLLQAFAQPAGVTRLRVDGNEDLLLALRRCVAASNPVPDFRERFERFAERTEWRDVAGGLGLLFDSLRHAAGDVADELRSAGQRHFASHADSAAFARRLEDLQLRADRLSARLALAERASAR